MKETKWEENVILVDADYVDKVAFDLTVNFERMIGRRIPKADMAQWLECVALDGGLRPQPSDLSLQTSIQVVLLHKQPKMENFNPGIPEELDGKAFKGRLGEILISCVKVENLTTMDDLFVDSMQIIANIGGINCNSVTKKTDYLVLGCNDYNPLVKDGKSGKQKKAEEYALKGTGISIMDEHTFYDLLQTGD